MAYFFGSGAIIFVGEIAVKASSVDRVFSVSKLCKRLGEFIPGDYAGEPEPSIPRLGPEPVSPSSSSTPPAAKPNETLAAYAAHWEIHQKQNARLAALAAGMALFGRVLNPPPESSSRQDARIALLMRVEGHSREAVTEAIRLYGSEWRDGENRDWRRYAARTASYAFGLAGDMELAHIPRMETKPVEPPSPPPKPSEDEMQRETQRLRLR